MDAETIIKERERREAVRLYRMHWWFTLLIGGLVGALTWSLAPPLDGESTWSDIRFFAFLLAGLFLGDWLGAVLFKRKSRPWHWGRHPDDEDPRK